MLHAVLISVSVLLFGWAIYARYQVRAALAEVTAQRRISAELRMECDLHRKRLQEAEAVVQELSHDLASPLVSISGFARSALAAQSDGQADKIAGYLQRVEANADGMQSLVKRLLTTARIGQENPAARDVRLSDLVDTLRTRLADDLGQQQARLHMMSDALLFTDPDMLTRALQNIVENALRHGTQTPGQVIEIACVERGDQMRISVSDEGPGIAQDLRPRLFEVFQRGTGGQDGCGLGLAIVARLANRLGGAVGFRSQTGFGSTFWIDLPKAPPEIATAA